MRRQDKGRNVSGRPIGGPTYPGEFSFGRFRDVRFVWTGEKRAVKAGEWYLSGAVPTAYKARGPLDYPYHIMRPATDAETRCPCCKQLLRGN